jgi:long-chain acyl-CoA synthetase
MSDSSLPLTLTMGLVKSVVCVYDVLSLPIYAAIQRPWQATNASQQVKAQPEDPSDPYSPWTRKSSPPDHQCYHSSSVADLFSRSCKKYKNLKAFGYREVFGEEDETQPDGKVFRKQILGDYKWFTYHQIDERIEHIARGFMSVGVKPGDVVLILAETRLEWMLSAQAIFRLGATIATLYTTLGQEGILHGINETEVTHIVTTYDVVPKIKMFHRLVPKVRTIIYIEGHKTPDSTGLPSHVDLIPFKTIEEKGRSATGLKFTTAQPDDPAVIMYTSGSTGIPKGVILTHRNVLTTIGGFFAVAHTLSQNGTYMAYLPLAHVLELAAETFFFSIGVSVGFSSPHTMTDKSTGVKKGQSGDAVLLQPTVMAAVPLVLDRIRKGVWDTMETRGKFAKAFFQFAIEYKKFWMKRGFRTPIVNAVVCSKIRSMLGGRIKQIVCGSAPLSPDTMEFVRVCLDVVVLQGYGLTETAAGSALMGLPDMSVGRVGPPLHGIKIKLVDWFEGQCSLSSFLHSACVCVYLTGLIINLNCMVFRKYSF